MNEQEKGNGGLGEKRPVPAWFRRERAIRVFPDAGYELCADDGVTGIRQTAPSEAEFNPREAAFLFGASSDKLYFRANFAAIVKVDCAGEEKTAMQKTLYNAQTGAFYDLRGPFAKPFHGIPVYRDALDMIPPGPASCPDFPGRDGLLPGSILLPVDSDGDRESGDLRGESDDSYGLQGVLFPEMEGRGGPGVQAAIDTEIERMQGEVFGRCRGAGNNPFDCDIAFMSNRCLVIVHGDMDGDWLAEEEPFLGEPPLWFSETEHCNSPGYQAKMCCQWIGKAIPGIPAFALVVFPSGTGIVNEEEMLEVWEKDRLFMVRTQKEGNSALPTLRECLDSLPAGSDSPSDKDIEALRALAKKLEADPMAWKQG